MGTRNPGAHLTPWTALRSSHHVRPQAPVEADAPFLPSDLPRPLHDGGRTRERPESHASNRAIGDHRHHAGEWMLSCRYRRMEPRGHRGEADSGLVLGNQVAC